MAKNLLTTIQVNFVLIPSEAAIRNTNLPVIKTFAINLYNHSHFLAAPTTFFTLSILNRAAPFLQLVFF